LSIKIDGLLAREKCGNLKKRKTPGKESEEEFISSWVWQLTLNGSSKGEEGNKHSELNALYDL